MDCILCRSDKNLTDEHVFPAFMGGRLEVRRASCDKCNRIFGVAEAAIKDATTPLLNLLRIKNRHGRVPNAPLQAEIQGLDLRSLPAYMDGNGEIRLRDYVKETITDDSCLNLRHKCRDFNRKFCHNLATIAGGQNLTSFLSNTLWRMSL